MLAVATANKNINVEAARCSQDRFEYILSNTLNAGIFLTSAAARPHATYQLGVWVNPKHKTSLPVILPERNGLVAGFFV